MRGEDWHVWGGRGATLAVCAVASGLVLAVSPSPADAACSWSFSWYCRSAGCARITGRTTDTVGGFSTEEACRSAISQFRRGNPGIGVGSCSRTGMCDEGNTVRRGTTPYRGRGSGGTVAPPEEVEPLYDAEAERQRVEQEEEMRRQEAEESDRLAKEQADRLAAQQKANRDRLDVLKGMKGVDFDGAGSVGAASGDLGLKSSTPTLGLKSSSGGELALKPSTEQPELGPRYTRGTKDSAPVDLTLKDSGASSPVSEPAPPPKRVVKTPDVHYLGDRTGNLVLDAIVASGHDLDGAVDRLDKALWRQPNDQAVRDAYDYVMGMSIGDSVARAGTSASGVPTFDPNLLPARNPSTPTLDKIERDRPADVNYAQFQNFYDWDMRHRKLAIDALSASGGNFVRARDDLERRLQANPTDVALQGAYRMMQGAAVYQDDVDKARAAAGAER